MNYPLISDYVSSILSAEDNFKELTNLRPVLNNEGQPIMSSGNFAVVFKMKDEQTEKLYAVKCFLKEQEGRAESYKLIEEELEFVSSNYLTPIRYMENELFVDSSNTDDNEFPILLMDWIEGVTLDEYIRQNINDKYNLEILACRFSLFAHWIISQPFSHGDLKPENIIVKNNGTLTLIDYDGMYVPAMKGQQTREFGTPNFRHPKRTEFSFDEHIDDFALISILLSLKAISLNPMLLQIYGKSETLLFTDNDYLKISKSPVIASMNPMFDSTTFRKLFSIFLLALTDNKIPDTLKLYLKFYPDEINEHISFFSKRLIYNYERALSGDAKSQNWIGYSYYYGEELEQDYKKALFWYNSSATQKYPTAVHNIGVCYNLGTGVIKDEHRAVKWFQKAADLGYLDSQFVIGKSYLNGDKFIKKDISKGLKYLLQAAENKHVLSALFLGIIYKEGKYIQQNKKEAFNWFRQAAKLGDEAAQYYLGLAYWNGEGVNKDMNEAIKWYEQSSKQGYSKAKIELNQWGKYWFDSDKALYSKDRKTILGVWSSSISEYHILDGTINIADECFCDIWSEIDCSYHDTIIIPQTVRSIGYIPFNYNLSTIICNSPHFEVINKTLYSKGKKRLIQCLSDEQIFIVPEEVEFIDDYAFYGCKSKQIIISRNVVKIGLNPFIDMGLEFQEEYGVLNQSQKFKIDNNALYDNNQRLISYWGKGENFTVPYGVKYIGKKAFWGSNLKIINLPTTIEAIEDYAFERCLNLKQVIVPADSYMKFKKIMSKYKGSTIEVER